MTWAVALFAFGCRTPSPDGQPVWKGGSLVEIDVADPRNVADRAEGKPRSCRTEKILLFRRPDGSVDAPLVVRREPRRGFFDEVRFEERVQPPLMHVGFNVAFPDDRGIRSYILLLRGLDEDTSWRVFEFDRRTFAPTDRLRVPELATLERLDRHEDGHRIWTAYEAAQRRYDALPADKKSKY